jgi:hypothetical protein
MKINILFFITILIFFGCEKKIAFNLKDQSKKCVVEGIIVNSINASYVKLSETSGADVGSVVSVIENATVLVYDQKGNVYRFIEKSPGFYQCPEGFTGKINEKYKLVASSKIYSVEAESTLPDTLKHLSFRYIKIPYSIPRLEAGYYVYAKFSDLPGVDNFFRVNFLVNGINTTVMANDIILYRDKLFQNLQNVEGLLKFWGNKNNDRFKIKKGDKIDVLVYGINADAYQHYQAIKNLPGSNDIFFGKYPSPLPTNIKGGLGFFETCNLKKATIIIND